MPLITLRRFLNRAEEESSLRRIISLLLQGMGLHAVEGDRNDYDQFQRGLEKIQAEAGDSATEEQLLVASGAAIQALGDYNQHTTQFIRRQGMELQKMVSMLSETVISISSGSERSVERLKDIGAQLEHAVVIQDVQQLKVRLGECLEGFRQEVERQKSEAKINITQLKDQVEHSHGRVSALIGDDIDRVTGLPGQALAEAAFAAALNNSGRKYVFVAVANRVQSVNMRFGYAVGDQVLSALAGHIRGQLSKADLLFRWQGPALVALLERQEPLDRVRGEVRRIGEARVEKMFDVGARQVLIPVNAAWSVFALIPPLPNVLKQIQSFIASQTSKDYC